MKLSTFLGVTGAFAILGGLPFLLFPESSIALFGLSTDPAGLLLTRYFGGAFFSFGVLVWYVRAAIDPDEHRHILVPLIICSIAGAVIALVGQFSGLLNALGWVPVLLFILFALGLGYYSRR